MHPSAAADITRPLSASRAEELEQQLAACEAQAEQLEREYRAILATAKRVKQQHGATRRAIRRIFALIRPAGSPRR